MSSIFKFSNYKLFFQYIFDYYKSEKQYLYTVFGFTFVASIHYIYFNWYKYNNFVLSIKDVALYLPIKLTCNINTESEDKNKNVIDKTNILFRKKRILKNVFSSFLLFFNHSLLFS